MVGTSLRILVGTELGQPGSLIGDDQIYNFALCKLYVSVHPNFLIGTLKKFLIDIIDIMFPYLKQR
jgi:hypothetical protein